MQRNYVLLVPLTLEQEIEGEVAKFVKRVIAKLNSLKTDKMISESTINPFLVRALGIVDFDSLARFYVYQHIGRSLVTSFGMTVMETMVKSIKSSGSGEWWDIYDLVHDGKHFYISVKSGPRDMDYDQVNEFSRRAKILLQQKPDAVPLIAMCYGKGPLGPIASTLRKQGFDPSETTLTGKELFETLTGQENFHKHLLDLTGKVALQTLSEKKVIEIIESKIKEIADAFRQKYGTVDKLLLDIF